MVDQHLVILLVKLAIAASMASILVRFEAFKRLLLREERTIYQRLQLTLALAAAFGAGVAVRVATGTYKAADLGLEASFLAGLLGGYVPGLLGGVLISLPAMFGGEMLTMPLYAAVGVLAGMLRDAAPELEEIWRVSPFLEMNLIRAIRNWSGNRRLVFHLILIAALMSLEPLRFGMSHLRHEGGVFVLYPEGAEFWNYVAVWFSTMFAVLLPLKIWANARTERQVEIQARLLQEARLRALTSQINPHFLFNTLNSIASLVRTDPDGARLVIVKLSNILRRLMKKTENVTSLREEMNFIEDYIAIEMVRFGSKLRYVKDVEGAVLEARVPSMILQPIVENSLKHGLASKVEGGTIRVRAWLGEGKLHLEVEDDGVGIPEARLNRIFEQGIGVSNVNERLQVLFGDEYRMWIDSKTGEGTRTGIEIPSGATSLAAVS
ncbi:MAG: histidine kinase [Bryobacterales bacterium]|nr:histidine kinase [Bryobacterales bacterium]